MIVRIARIITLVMLFNLFVSARPAIGEGWAMPKNFPDNKTEAKKAPPKQTKPQPSTLDKMTSGTKRFFSNIGNALSFKKSAPQKKSTTPTNPWIKPPKDEPPKSSWLTSIFPNQEPKKPSSPSEWLEQKRLDP